MVKVSHSISSITQKPLLLEYVNQIRVGVKGLSCPDHPGLDSAIKISYDRQVGKPVRLIDACCADFENKIKMAISAQSR